MTIRGASKYLGLDYQQLYQLVIRGRGPKCASEQPSMSMAAGGPKRIERMYTTDDLDAWRQDIDRRRREYKESVAVSG